MRTALAAVDILRGRFSGMEAPEVIDSLTHTAARMDFHGRWERLSTNPDVICDIGHNAPALKYNFGQLNSYLESGK